MNWFVTRIVYRIVTGKGDHTPQFDEQIRLISADNESVAYEKATRLGQSGQDSFPNRSGEKVEWKFEGLAELTELDSLEDGMELSSRIIETGHAENYSSFIQDKNEDIEYRLIYLKTQNN